MCIKIDIVKTKEKTTIVVNKNKEEYDVYIGRGSKWGNPFVIGKDGDRNKVLKKYSEYLLNNPELLSSLGELKGKRLGCYCKPNKCHGDILVYLIESGQYKNFK